MSYSTRLIIFFASMVVVSVALIGAIIYVMPKRIAQLGESSASLLKIRDDASAQINKELPSVIPQTPPQEEKGDQAPASDATLPLTQQQGEEEAQSAPPQEIPEEAMR